MARYFLCWGAPEPLARFWSDLRSDFRSWHIKMADKAPPHITLLAPRALCDMHAEQLMERARELCRDVRPLYAEPQAVRCFPDAPHLERCTLYVPFAGRGVQEHFESLVRMLSMGLPPVELEGKTMHLTVAQVPLAQDGIARYRAAHHQPPPHVRLDRLVWYRKEAGGAEWEEVDHIQLEPSFQEA